MIIQCEQCQTKFKLDDSKVADKSIKVRCARCRHVFTVARIQPAPEESVSFWQDETPEPAAAVQEPVVQLHETAPDFEYEVPAPAASPEPDDFLSFDNFELPEEAPASPVSAPVEDTGDFFFDSAEDTVHDEQPKAPEAHDDLDFGAFDFGSMGDDAAEPAPAARTIDFGDSAPEPPAAAPAAPAGNDFGGLDFTGDDMFGEISSPAAEESPSGTIAFDIGMDEFSDSFGVEESSSAQNIQLSPAEQAVDNPFSLDDIDFGDELSSVAVQQVSTEELKPAQDLLFAPIAAGETQRAFDTYQAPPQFQAPHEPEEEPPPLSITSRRRESPRFSGMLLLLGVLIAGLVVFYGYWGYTTLSEEKAAAVPQEAGRITVRKVEAAFVKNRTLGNLLVISGEAVNEFSKPRAAVQVKGIVYGADGRELTSKSAFCGNPLTAEQLTTMTQDKIEAAMANQFGDSLANMEVAAGAAIPFVIVIPQPAADAKDYGVEPVGSTVATGKDK
jgi:predicted Zn finger-like uncharacterized protein